MRTYRLSEFALRCAPTARAHFARHLVSTTPQPAVPDPPCPACTGEFVAHSGDVNCVRIGRGTAGVLATGGQDKKVNLWRTGQAEVVKVGRRAPSLAFAPLFDCHTEQCCTLPSHAGQPAALPASPCHTALTASQGLPAVCRVLCCRASVGCSLPWSVWCLVRRRTQSQRAAPMEPSKSGTWIPARVSRSCERMQQHYQHQQQQPTSCDQR